MRNRNMWISETGQKHDTSTTQPVDSTSNIDVKDAQVDTPVSTNEDTSPDAACRLLIGKLSLDELVPRSWKKY